MNFKTWVKLSEISAASPPQGVGDLRFPRRWANYGQQAPDSPLDQAKSGIAVGVGNVFRQELAGDDGRNLPTAPPPWPGSDRLGASDTPVEIDLSAEELGYDPTTVHPKQLLSTSSKQALEKATRLMMQYPDVDHQQFDLARGRVVQIQPNQKGGVTATVLFKPAAYASANYASN